MTKLLYNLTASFSVISRVIVCVGVFILGYALSISHLLVTQNAKLG